MARQGYDLQLTRYDEKGWRATFYTTGMEHAPTSATGTGWQRTPWHATQRAAWGGIVRGILDEEIALTPGNFFPVPVSIPLERHRSVVAGFHRSLCALDVATSRREDWCVASALLYCVRFVH